MAISKRNNPVALATLTSANGTARLGASHSVEQIAVGSLAFECTSAITTTDVLATFKVQVSVDGSAWFDVAGASASTPVGTASPVTTRIALPAPQCVHGWPLVRVVATLSGAATAGADVTTVRARWVAPGGLDNNK